MPKPRKAKPSGRRPVPRKPSAASKPASKRLYEPLPGLEVVFDTAPVGLACLTLDCRYLQINRQLTEICGMSVADHIGRLVRDTVPAVAEQVETIVANIARTGEPITGVEVRGQRADGSNADHVWITNWHPLKGLDGRVVSVSVVAEDITERKRAEAALTTSEKALRESETRFRELADNISQFAWTADETGWIYWYNKRWLDYTGTTLDEMEGWGWRKVHHPDHVERVIRRIRRSFEDGTPWEDTFPLRARDGSYRWFLSRALPIRDEAGSIIRWFGTNTDVTAQIEAEKALRDLNETLEHRVEKETRERLQIWNVSQDLLVVADLDGRYLSTNPAWKAALGWSETDLIGKTSEWILHPDDRQKTRAEIAQLAGRKTMQFENRFRHRDGSYRWISWKTVPDRGRLYAMGRDVTNLKDAESELRQIRRELAQSARRANLAAMSGAIAHEITQPISAIVTSASAGMRWLNRSPPNLDKALKTFSDIVGAGRRTSEVIHSVRAMFTKSDHPRAALDTNELIRETIALVHGELEEAGIVLQFDLEAQLPPIVGHRGQLQQVILNIVGNAADAMRPVVDRARVLRLRSEMHRADHIAVSFEDSGTGIAAKDIDHIFDAFFTTKSSGMGMGLAICHSIVEAHGGSLSVSNATPHGSVFCLVLPSNR